MTASVVCNAVIRNVLEISVIWSTSCIECAVYSAKPKSLSPLLVKLLASQGQAARAHRAKLANLMGRLFHKTSDPRTNFVKERL